MAYRSDSLHPCAPYSILIRDSGVVLYCQVDGDFRRRGEG